MFDTASVARDYAALPVAAIALPKHYRAQKGYPHPDYFAICYDTTLRLFYDYRVRGEKNLTVFTGATLFEKLLDYRLPTYFAAPDLLTALSKTAPPESGDWSEFKLPFPAIRFLFPIDWCQEVLGRQINHAVIGLLSDGETIGCRWPHKHQINVNGNGVSIFFEAVEPEGFPEAGQAAQFYTNINMDQPLSFSLEAPFQYWDIQGPHNGEEAEGIFTKRVISLVIGLAMTMTAVPEFLEPPKLLQQALTTGKGPTKEIQRPALWEAGFVGRHYRIPVPKEHQGGTHNSPIAHWRCGHWRHQRFGPALVSKKLIWMKPVFVGATAAAN